MLLVSVCGLFSSNALPSAQIGSLFGLTQDLLELNGIEGSSVLLQQFWASRHPYKPITASEMAERFKYEFHVGIAISEELSIPVTEEEQLANVSVLAGFTCLIIICKGPEMSFDRIFKT